MATYELISTQTVGAGGAASIDFTSIPASWTDLLLKVSSRGTNSAVSSALVFSFNTDTGATSYTYRALQGSGSAATSFYSNTNFIFAGNQPSANATANTFGNAEIYIPNYTGSTAKSISSDLVGENNATESYTNLIAGIWSSGSSSSAINAIKLTNLSGNLAQNSTASLYGIKN